MITLMASAVGGEALILVGAASNDMVGSSPSAAARCLLGLPPRQHCAAGDAGVVAQLGGNDVNAFHRARHGVVVGGFDDDAQHLVGQGLDDSAAQHHHFGAEDIDEVGGGDANVRCRILNHPVHKFVPASDGFEHVAAA